MYSGPLSLRIHCGLSRHAINYSSPMSIRWAGKEKTTKIPSDSRL